MRAMIASVLAFLALAAGCAVVTTVPAPPKGRYAMIDDCRYSDAAAARKAWEPREGSLPVSVAAFKGNKAILLPCNFLRMKGARAAWDRKVNLDLTACQGIQFKFYCPDTSPVSSFMIYFQSGDGWYSDSFFPKTSATWNTIVIDKAATRSEGAPAGWARIKAIRIAAGRGRYVNTEMYLSDMAMVGVLGVDAMVAIVRADSAAQQRPDEARSVDEFSEAVAKGLSAAGVGYAMISDLDVTAERLKGAKIVILPHNPGMPDNVADEIIKYLNGGGKLLVFYTLPPKVRPAVQIEGGAHKKASYPGFFSTIRFTEGALPGAPPSVAQASWNISEAKPVPGASRALAHWFDDKGQPTGFPAIVASNNCIQMTHVLLPNDVLNKRRLLLAMVGSLAPDLWKQAVETSIAQIGQTVGYESMEQAVNRIIGINPDDRRVSQTVVKAQLLCEEAESLCSQGRYPEAAEAAAEAARCIGEAYCMAQRPLKGEFRAFWCHSAFGVEGMDWDKAIKTLADNGFTAILPNMLWGGVAYYPSKVLPVATEVADKGDQMAKCAAACRKYGVQIHVWKVNWNMGSRTPKEFADKMWRDGRVQVDSEGNVKGGADEGFWLCPSHPENQKLEIESMLEVARLYNVNGLHFDYIRYPGGNCCFCTGCRDRFERSIGQKIKDWPKAVLPNGPLRTPWLDWRRSHITTVVRAVSERARKLKPAIKISAAVFRNWLADRDSVGQDWKDWCDKGYLDFVCPMDYTASDEVFTNYVTNQKVWAGKTPCYPGIGAHSSRTQLTAAHVIGQIKITRQLNTNGFVIFNYGPAEAKDLVPLLGMGITAKK